MVLLFVTYYESDDELSSVDSNGLLPPGPPLSPGPPEKSPLPAPPGPPPPAMEPMSESVMELASIREDESAS